MSYRILLVDDDQENIFANQALLQSSGYDVTTVNSGEEAIKTVKRAKKDFALILMDYHMPTMMGTEAIRQIKQVKPNQQILTFSMDDTSQVVRDNFLSGGSDFIDKNVDNETLLKMIANYCAKYESLFRTITQDEIEICEQTQFIRQTGMIGRSEKLFNLCKDIRKVAPTSATVMILGESGTGKELVARALHDLSGRPNDKFVAVNIAAESPTLLDSSLFGHKKGAFTGAFDNHIGKFELANNGTLFLDEIGDMPLDMQVKLLRVLQEKQIVPVGTNTPKSINVRIVAATHKNLNQMVKEGKFREDLYYRLMNITLSTAALRDRPEDIELLVAHFAAQVCDENNIRKSLHRSCLDVFRSFDWPGNVRQLRSVVEKHLLCCDSDSVKKEDLDPALFKISKAAPVTLKQLDIQLEEIKKNHVREILKNFPKKSEAARKLDIEQNLLSYFVNKWGL